MRAIGGIGLSGSAAGSATIAMNSTSAPLVSASTYGDHAAVLRRAIATAVSTEPASIVTPSTTSWPLSAARSTSSRLLRENAPIANATQPMNTGIVAAEITAARRSAPAATRSNHNATRIASAGSSSAT